MAAPSRRRRWIILALVLGSLLLAAWWVDRQLEPQRLTAIVLREAGDKLSLELTIEGQPDYSLRPEPRLLLPKLTVRRKGDATPLLVATRAEISLPWATLTDSEAALVITRIELDQPVLDLPALRRWQATQPDEPFELPTLTRGLQVSAGTARDESWSLQALELTLPTLATGQPAEAHASGRFSTGIDRIDFEADAVMARAALASPLSLDASGQWTRGSRRTPFALKLAGRYEDADDVQSLLLETAVLDSESPLPDLNGRGSARLGEPLALSFVGTLPHWPAGWPTLPTPVAESTSPLQLKLDYTGSSDLAAPLTLALSRDDTRLQASLRLTEMQAWLDASDAAPLPPLSATLESPRLEVEGAVLEGVRMEISEDPPVPASQ